MFSKESKLIGKLFCSSLAVFFLSTLTASLGSLVDGIVIGNTMHTSSVAAYGLVTPRRSPASIWAPISRPIPSAS